MKLKPYIPYPISLMRLFINLIGISVLTIFVESAYRNNIDTNHPFFWLLCLFIFGCFGFASHYPVNWILKRMKAKTYHSFVDSLWEGALLIMVTVNSSVIVLLGLFGVVYRDLSRGVFPRFLDQAPSKNLSDLSPEAWWSFGCYCAIVLFFYQLEYLARHPEEEKSSVKKKPINLSKSPRPSRTSTKKTATPKKPDVEQSPPRPKTKDEIIDEELRRLKTRLDNEKRFDQ